MTQTTLFGLDIGGTNARAARIELENGPSVVARAHASVRADLSPEGVAKTCLRLVDELRQGTDPADCVIGVGFAGQLGTDRDLVINAPNLAWRDVRFGSLLSQHLGGAKVALYNDLSSIVWGEYRAGGARGFDDLLAIYVGTGVGGGLIQGGRLYEGHAANAGEIGHCKLPQIKTRCGCGQLGCVEALAGGLSIERRLREDLGRNVETSLAGLEHPLNASHVEQAFMKGDAYAMALWSEISEALAFVLSGAIGLLNPHALLLGGGVLEGCPELRRQVIARLSVLTVAVAWDGLEVIAPTLGPDAGPIGAALLASSATQ